MINVKILQSSSIPTMEQQISDFLENFDGEIQDIKVYPNATNCTAVITYIEQKNIDFDEQFLRHFDETIHNENIQMFKERVY